MGLRIAISMSSLSAREMESDSDGSDREERPRSAASKRIRKPCSVEGCSTLAHRRGLCSKHGGYTRCREEGCEKVAVSGGLCIAHGGGGSSRKRSRALSDRDDND